MKIKNIVNPSAAKQSKVVFHKSINESRYAIRRELLTLLKSDEEGLIGSCPSLASDEIEFLGVILTRLKADLSYEPSEWAIQLVVDANSRIWASGLSA